MNGDWGLNNDDFEVIETDSPRIALKTTAKKFANIVTPTTDIGDLVKLLNTGLSPKHIGFKPTPSHKTIPFSDVLVGHPDSRTYESIRNELEKELEEDNDSVKSTKSYFFIFQKDGDVHEKRKENSVMGTIPDKILTEGDNNTRLITDHSFRGNISDLTLVYATPSIQRRQGQLGRLNLHVEKESYILTKARKIDLCETILSKRQAITAQPTPL